MSGEIIPRTIMEFLTPRLGARLKTWLSICAHCGMCADTCHFYLAHNRDPKMIPSYKIRFINDIIKKYGGVDREYLQEIYKTVYYECNMCRRCTLYCPFGIDIAMMISLLRAMLLSQGMAPQGLLAAINNYKESGNQMNISDEEWVETVQWIEEEMSEELVGLTVPIDKHGAKIMYTVNAREPKFYPQDMMEVAKIFYVAGEDYTYCSQPGWDDTNLAMFAGDVQTARTIVENVFKRADELGVEKVAVTECGHAFRAVKYEAPGWLGYTPKQEVVHSVELFHDYIRDGRIKLRHKIKEPTTVQDPCNVVRNGGLMDKNRRLAEMLSEDFRPMKLQGNYSYCCGGGGGAMPMGGEMKKYRLQSGKIKAEQIRETGAKIIFVPCHNCIDQIRDLNKEYDLGVKAIHFKEAIAELMVIPEHMKPKEQAEDDE
ncbi:MAG: (Fe-S)-binding protein [Deltaproteobacteria bacterium]|nr:(Fe-S)-binding protein [Deltaproteobacteria bacterium]MBF0524579.1 (Fe-S)-binding protein [Deltaproteobacteria bacterium]